MQPKAAVDPCELPVNLIPTNQYLSQLDEDVRDSVLGNVGTLVSFWVGPADAAVLAEEFAPEFSPNDLMSLPNYCIYLRLMIGGVVSKSFSATTVDTNGLDRMEQKLESRVILPSSAGSPPPSSS